MSSCYATGAVSGDGDDYGLGGLVGRTYGCTMSSCYATGVVSGDGYVFVGGLVGLNQRATISSCYATGAVSGDRYVGGLVGDGDYGTLNRSYFLDTAGPHNGFGVPLSDAAMRQQASFVGFDFVGPGDGDEEIWRIDEGLSYPYFVWQIQVIPGDFDLDGDVDKDDLRALDDCANPCIIANVNADAAGVNVADLQDVKNHVFCIDDTSAGCIISDVNRDGDVNVIDLQDVKNMAFCTDTAVDVTSGCEWADFDDDGDIDYEDYAVIQGCVSGPGIPADPNCAD